MKMWKTKTNSEPLIPAGFKLKVEDPNPRALPLLRAVLIGAPFGVPALLMAASRTAVWQPVEFLVAAAAGLLWFSVFWRWSALGIAFGGLRDYLGRHRVWVGRPFGFLAWALRTPSRWRTLLLSHFASWLLSAVMCGLLFVHLFG